MFNFLIILGSLIAFLVIFVISKVVIKPYLGLLEYKRQGVGIIFHKEITNLDHANKNGIEKGDFNYHYKEFLRKNPNAKCVAENFVSDAMLIILDADMIKQFLQDFELYLKDVEVAGLLKSLAPGSSLYLEGAPWKERRRVQSPSFHFEFLKNMIPMIVEMSESMMYDQWIKENKLKKVDIQNESAINFGNILGRFAFGKKYSSTRIMGLPITIVLRNILETATVMSLEFPVLVFGPEIVKKNIFPHHKRHNKMVDALFQAIEDMIQETDRSVDQEFNFVSNLLKLRKENPDNFISNADIISEFMILFGAGVSTSAIATTSILYLLSKHPECLRKVKEEIDREMSDPNSITYESLTRMTYIHAVIKEGMRVMGPTNPVVFRVAAKDHELCGVKIKKGAKVNALFAVLHQSEKYFPDADQFVPERWLPESPYAKDGYKIDPFAFLPFSGGPRNCIGQHLAVIQMKVFLGLFLRNFDYKIPEDFTPKMTLKLEMEFHESMFIDLFPKNPTKA